MVLPGHSPGQMHRKKAKVKGGGMIQESGHDMVYVLPGNCLGRMGIGSCHGWAFPEVLPGHLDGHLYGVLPAYIDGVLPAYMDGVWPRHLDGASG